MSQLTRIYYEVTPDFQLGKPISQAELSPVFKEYQVDHEAGDHVKFYALRCASFFLNPDDLRRLLCGSKALHAFLAEVKDQFNFRPPSQTVDLGVNAWSFMHLLNSLKEHEFLVASEFRHDYITSDDAQGREQTNLSSNFCFLSEVKEDQFIDFSPLLQKAPFLQGLTLRLMDHDNLEGFLATYPKLPFVKDLILCMTGLPMTFRAIQYYHTRLKETGTNEGETDYKYMGQKAINYIKDLQWQIRTNQQTQTLLQRSPYLEKLVIRDDHFMPTNLEGLAPRSLPHLKLIEIESGLMTTRVVHQLMRAAPNLEKLILNSPLYEDDLFLCLKPNSLPRLTRIILPDNRPDKRWNKLLGDFGEEHINSIKAAARHIKKMRTHHYNQPTPGSFTVFIPEPK